MKALLVVAHGSPRPEANEDVRKVTELVAARDRWPIVNLGYLDCNEPDIPTAIEQCIARGASEVVVVPYFLHSGKHFLIDIPEMLEAAAGQHPGVRILMGDYLGHEPQIADVLRDRVNARRESS